MLNFRNFITSLYPFDESRTVFLNDDGTIISWTEKLAARNKLTKEQTVGKNFSVLFKESQHDQPFYDQLLTTAAQKGKAKKAITLKKSDGKPLQTKVVVDAIKDEKGGVLGYTVVAPH